MNPRKKKRGTIKWICNWGIHRYVLILKCCISASTYGHVCPYNTQSSVVTTFGVRIAAVVVADVFRIRLGTEWIDVKGGISMGSFIGFPPRATTQSLVHWLLRCYWLASPSVPRWSAGKCECYGWLNDWQAVTLVDWPSDWNSQRVAVIVIFDCMYGYTSSQYFSRPYSHQPLLELLPTLLPVVGDILFFFSLFANQSCSSDA